MPVTLMFNFRTNVVWRPSKYLVSHLSRFLQTVHLFTRSLHAPHDSPMPSHDISNLMLRMSSLPILSHRVSPVMHLKVLISVDLGKRSAMIVSALVPMAWVFLQVSQGLYRRINSRDQLYSLSIGMTGSPLESLRVRFRERAAEARAEAGCLPYCGAGCRLPRNLR